MKMPEFGWFDGLVLVLLVVGFFRGRKRGMSMELLPLFQWLLVVVAGSYVYEALGDRLASATNGTLNLLWSYIIVYALFILVVHMVFSRMKRAVGEKLVGGDIFGSMEYYFGMGAGIIRFACFVLIGLALLNAKPIDHKKEEQNRRMQRENFGSISFPTYGSIQKDIFSDSWTGKFAKEHLKHLLIKETSPDLKVAARKSESISRKREKAVNEVIAEGTN